ncbi:MAG: hypothetical protein ABIJ59_03710 [Pseudomonadota bacterium]
MQRIQHSLSATSPTIVSAAVPPVDGLTLAAYFNSEPDGTDRNDTLGSSTDQGLNEFFTRLALEF